MTPAQYAFLVLGLTAAILAAWYTNPWRKR